MQSTNTIPPVYILWAATIFFGAIFIFFLIRRRIYLRDGTTIDRTKMAGPYWYLMALGAVGLGVLAYLALHQS
ncbi:MAG TPA: hypothetical protein VHL34_03800 [Rhizomicrobium sp.]|nr:hypothetical protein [Rhizomicrobium sp.]